jgi:hypothetical protein
MKVPLYLCFGGPLDGFKVTEQYAGDDYVRYSSSCGQLSKLEKVEYKPGQFGWRATKEIRAYKSILVYCSEI